MIYTVTFSPAIDYVVHMDSLKVGATNRSKQEEYYFGGKGINVSTVLRSLEIESVALGFVSGFTGRALEEGLKNNGIKTDFISLDNGITRINVKIKGECETEINGQGPNIGSKAVEELFSKFDKLTIEDVLVISGSVPESMPKDIYEQILKRMQDKDVMCVVDATGKLLMNVLSYGPFLIKPNNDEISEMFGRKIESADEIVAGARELKKMGARNVLVSRGAKGAILLTEDDEVIEADAIKGKTVNTVGAGDSMVAGFLAGYMKEKNYNYALKLGTAAGSATACSLGLATAEEIRRRMEQ